MAQPKHLQDTSKKATRHHDQRNTEPKMEQPKRHEDISNKASEIEKASTTNRDRRNRGKIMAQPKHLQDTSKKATRHHDRRNTEPKMEQPKRHEDISNKASAIEKAVRRHKVSKCKNSLPAELQLRIVRFLPRTSLPTICLLNKQWRSVGTEELLRRLLPDLQRETDKDTIFVSECLLQKAIFHFIGTNNSAALQHLLEFRSKHTNLRRKFKSLLLAEPASLRKHVTKDEEERFCLDSYLAFCSSAVKAAFKYNDMSCMQLLIDHGLADYSRLLNTAVDDGLDDGFCDELLARPIPKQDSCCGQNSVLNWLLACPPRHVVQTMLVMWGELHVHPRLLPLCDRRDRRPRAHSRGCDSMLIVAAGRGHPASLQTIDELRMMVQILTDDASGSIIPEARKPLSHALQIARGMASMWPGTPPLVADYLQSVCRWEGHQRSSSSSKNTHNSPPPPAPPLILPPRNPVLHRLIDLKTYDGMLEPENWLELGREARDHPLLMWLVSTEFLADEEAARRMRCFKRSLCMLPAAADFLYRLLDAAGAFRRWRCIEVVVGELRGMWPGQLDCSPSPNLVLRRAILDAVHGEPGCADGSIIRKLLRTGTRNWPNFTRFGVADGPFRGGCFGWEPLRLAFVERQQDREKRETPACMEMRDVILEFLSISDRDALNFLIDEPSRALYRASTRRRRKRWADTQERGKGVREGKQPRGK